MEVLIFIIKPLSEFKIYRAYELEHYIVRYEK